jgi:hypothetical protein
MPRASQESHRLAFIFFYAMVGRMMTRLLILSTGPLRAGAVARILRIPGTLACPGRAR